MKYKKIISAISAFVIFAVLLSTASYLPAFAYGGNPGSSEIGSPTGETDNLSWSVEGTVLTISGEGFMYDYHRYYDVPWYEYADEITEIVIEEGVTNVGKYCGAYMPNLTKVVLPSTITSISGSSFNQSVNLSEIIIPDGVESIGQQAFYRNASLTSINIPASVKEICARAFDSCSNLENVDIAEGSTLETIGSGAFNGCSGLTKFTIPDTVTIFGSDVFSSCLKIEKIVYGKSLTKISNYAFTGLTGLKTFVCRGEITSIGTSAFQNCINLETFEIQNKIEKIDSKAFYFCQALTEFPYLDDIDEVAEDAFEKSGVVTIETAEGVCFSAGTIYVTPDYAGKNVTVPINIKDNKTFTRAILSLMYDDKLEFKSANTDIMGWVYVKSDSSANMQLLGECYSDEDGILVNLTFTLPEDIETGDSFGVYVSSFNFETTTDITEGYEEYNVFGGKIKIVDSISQGDVNNDSKVDINDVKALEKFICSKSTAADSNTSDLNGDGVVNVIDLALLKEIIAEN